MTLGKRNEAVLAALRRRLEARLLAAQKTKESSTLEIEIRLELHWGVVNAAPKVRLYEQIPVDTTATDSVT